MAGLQHYYLGIDCLRWTKRYHSEQPSILFVPARGAAVQQIVDDGTIAPTAAGGSIAFAPEICLPALKAMKAKYGNKLYGPYGFRDAFNPTYTYSSQYAYGPTTNGWFDIDYLGIDQGPIILMTETRAPTLSGT